VENRLKPTLLIDLDDTLLSNDINTFLPAYLQALSKSLADYAPPEKLVPNLLAATRQMVRNSRPDQTLKQVFDQAFYPSLGLKALTLQDDLEQFYGRVFPTLAGLTRPRPEAVRLVISAFERGWRVAVTTNPLFPRTAILQRLAWGGLPIEQFPFELVTSYETFHFAKPSPAYFAEVVGRLGWPEGPIIVIGDDLQNDIYAARKLGLAAYWLEQPGMTIPYGPNGPSGYGPLGGVLEWIEAAETEILQPNFSGRQSMLAVLRSTPAVLDTLTDELTPDDWTRRPEPQAWNLTEIACHLRDVEREVNLERIEAVLKDDNPFLAGKDTDAWAAERGYAGQDGRQALIHFTDCRMTALDLLEPLQPEDWRRPARHAIFSRTQLAELVGITAGHDRLHVKQVMQTLAPDRL
jgi:FMN phosphatase YigB (HAD superfamily)